MAVAVGGSSLVGLAPPPGDLIVIRLAAYLRRLLDPRSPGTAYQIRERGVTNNARQILCEANPKRELVGFSTALGGEHTISTVDDVPNFVGTFLRLENSPIYLPIASFKSLCTAQWRLTGSTLPVTANAITVIELIREK